MMGLMQLNFDRLNRIEVAIERLKTFEPPEGYYLANSGGKDSVVLEDLAKKAEVKFDSHHNMISMEPPETIQFLRQYYPNTFMDKPKRSFWEAMVKEGFPTSRARWCCREFKERGGEGRLVLTGVRWAESVRRTNRKMIETCRSFRTKRFLHPIIDWETNEIWEYVRENKLPLCKLYAEGRDRIGCILCPMVGTDKALADIERFPKTAEAWHRTFIRRYNFAKEHNLTAAHRWTDAEALWHDWIYHRYESSLPDKDGLYPMFI